MSVRTEPRLTRDADLAVPVNDAHEAEALVRALQGRGWQVVAAVEQEAVRRLATVRLAAAGEDARGAVVDLLFASSGIEPEIVAAAEAVDVVPGLRFTSWPVPRTKDVSERPLSPDSPPRAAPRPGSGASRPA